MRSAVLFGLPLAALAVPAPVTQNKNILDERAEDFNPYLIEDGCRGKMYNDGKVDGYNKLITAVKEAREMAKFAIKEWWDEGKHGEAAQTYLAIPNDGGYKDSEYAQRVHANLEMVAKLDERIPFLSKKVNVHCTDIDNKCNTNVEGTNKPIGGYALNGGNVVTGYTYDVVLCDPWFLTQTPDDAWNEWGDDPKENIALEWLDNDAAKMLHEFMHIDMITRDRPHIPDKMYNGARAYTAPTIADWVANGEKTEVVIQNADSYAQFVNAIYFTDLFGFLPPPRRIEPIKETKECFPTVGEAQLYVDSAQDKHIADFCNKIAEAYQPGSIGEMVHEYDVDKPEHVRMRFYRRPVGKLGQGAVRDQCLTVMPKLFHECDTDSKWKKGGVYTFSQGDDDMYTYYVEPRHTRPDPIPAEPPALCNVWSKFAHVEFTISGGLFAGNDHGQEKLLPALRTCGVVTDWEFHYKESGEPDENNIEWDSTGSLPLGAHMWGCVRWAMMQAGAPESLGCGGH